MFTFLTKPKFKVKKSPADPSQYVVRDTDSDNIVYMGTQEQCKKYVSNRLETL
jgi:hypothetical protein